MVAIAVHGGFATSLSFSFDGEALLTSTGHGKVLVACSNQDTWCQEGMRSIRNAEVDGGFLLINAWNGFSAPVSPGLPAGVWAENAVIGPELMDPENPDAFSPWGESAAMASVKDAAGIPLCRAAAQIGSGIHPGEPIIDFSMTTVRLDKSVPGVHTGFDAGMTVVGAENVAMEGEVFPGRELASLHGLLENEEAEMQPQTGCSEGTGSSSPLSVLGGGLVLLGLGVLKRTKPGVRQGM